MIERKQKRRRGYGEGITGRGADDYVYVPLKLLTPDVHAPGAFLASVSAPFALRASAHVAVFVESAEGVLGRLAVVHCLPPFQNILGLRPSPVTHYSPGFDDFVA